MCVGEILLATYLYGLYSSVSDVKNLTPESSSEDRALAYGGLALSINPIGGEEKGMANLAKDGLKVAGNISKNTGAIEISKEAIDHVVKRHAWNTVKEDVSTFFKGTDLVKLINKSAETTAELEAKTGNYIRTVESSLNIGIDVATNKATNIYTVITQKIQNGTEKLITSLNLHHYSHLHHILRLQPLQPKNSPQQQQ